MAPEKTVPQKHSAELRDAPRPNGLAIRKDLKDHWETFPDRWCSTLKGGGVEWDGRRAVSELKRKDWFNFLTLKKRPEQEEKPGNYSSWQAENLMDRMVEELKAYQKEALGKLVKEEYDEIDRFLKAQIRGVQKKEGRTKVLRLKTLLRMERWQIETKREELKKLKLERQNWQHPGIWEEFWPKIRRKNLVPRKIELDTRLQVELGKMLADYLRPEDKRERVSMDTIARLILLTYFVAGFAYVDESVDESKGPGVKTRATERVLSIRKIRDNLRYAGLHNAKNFRRTDQRRVRRSRMRRA